MHRLIKKLFSPFKSERREAEHSRFEQKEALRRGRDPKLREDTANIWYEQRNRHGGR